MKNYTKVDDIDLFLKDILINKAIEQKDYELLKKLGTPNWKDYVITDKENKYNMSKLKIHSYYDEDKLKLHKMNKDELVEYIDETMVAKSEQSVIVHINKYYRKYNCSDKVLNFLENFIVDVKLLRKTQIVKEASYRNCVILVKPDRLLLACGHEFLGDNYNEKDPIKDAMEVFRDRAEKIFIVLSY